MPLDISQMFLAGRSLFVICYSIPHIMLYTLCKVAFAAALLISNTEAQLPLAKRQANQAFCSTVKSRATQGAQHKSATAFCSSYISIPVSTSTQTVSTSTVTLKRTSIITSTLYAHSSPELRRDADLHAARSALAMQVLPPQQYMKPAE